MTGEQHQESQHRAVTQCSFCEKTQAEVERLIGGPHGVAICNECVTLCVSILEDRTPITCDLPPESGTSPQRDA